MAIDITDAKPLLPEGVTNFYVTITEVLAHRSGGAWESLPLPQTPSPFTIDLLQFSDGITTELVPPVSLVSGKYTQIRLVLEEGSAKIKFTDDPTEYTVVIPSGNLKTDKNIDFNVPSGGSVDLMIDFDLSQSIVVTDDGSGTLSYKCKPVLHIVDTFKAATITGTIAYSSFNGSDAIVTVFDANGEVYTKLTVEEDGVNNDVDFSIFWLVPNQVYRVEIDFDPPNGHEEFTEDVSANNLGPGQVWYLNDPTTPNDEGEPI